MSELESLLIARRRECEEQRRYLADLDHLAERLRTDARRLLGARAAPEAMADTAAMELRYRKLTGSIAEIEDQIVAARDTLAAAERQLERSALARPQRHRAAPAAARALARPRRG